MKSKKPIGQGAYLTTEQRAMAAARAVKQASMSAAKIRAALARAETREILERMEKGK